MASPLLHHAPDLARMKVGKKDFTTVGVVFRSSASSWASHLFTYKVLKRWGIKVGDRVIVEIPSGELRIVEVTEVHAKPNITGSEKYKFKWIVQRINRTAYDYLTKMDQTIRDQIEAQETERLLRESTKIFRRVNRKPRGKK